MLSNAHVILLGATIAIGLTAACGCSPQTKPGRVPVFPVNGKVLAKDQPVEGAEVVFYGATPELTGHGKPAPAGVTDASGEFRLRSYDPEDGAPAGKFNVTIYWPEPIPPGADEEMYQRKDRFGGRYVDPKTSGLSIEVPDGGGELPPFALK